MYLAAGQRDRFANRLVHLVVDSIRHVDDRRQCTRRLRRNNCCIFTRQPAARKHRRRGRIGHRWACPTGFMTGRLRRKPQQRTLSSVSPPRPRRGDGGERGAREAWR